MKVTGRGKSGGYRVIYYFVVENLVWWITIYDKVRKEDLSASEKERILELVKRIKDR